MGLLALNRLISMRQRWRCQIHRRDGSIVAVAKRKGTPCQEEDSSPGGKRSKYSGPDLPEDIWRHILSLMPMRDAARAACVSRNFLHSWRCHPNLTLNEHTLRLKESAPGRDFIRKVDHILKNHSGISLKTFRLQLIDFYDANVRRHHLDSWLQIAVAPEIEEISLMLTRSEANYNFPFSLLSNGIGNSIRYFRLSFCAFHPTVKHCSFKNLIKLHLYIVHITDAELECLLSSSSALELLELKCCPEIICLKIHCLLQRLSCFMVMGCRKLQAIECKAPNLSYFHFSGEKLVKLLLGEALKLKELWLSSACLVCYARSELPSIVSNLEILTIHSSCEVINTPMLQSKFLHLKHLNISLVGWTFSPSYDYFSLVSLLYASPYLETFTLNASQQQMKHESIFEDSTNLRQMEHHNDHLKSVKITGFNSAKSLVELTCQIIQNALTLECLTLDTTTGYGRCSDKNYVRCFLMGKGILTEAPRALTAIRTYIEEKVPSTVKLCVVEPCSLCHAISC